MDAEVVGLIVAKGGKIGCPRTGDGGTPNYVL